MEVRQETRFGVKWDVPRSCHKLEYYYYYI